MRSHNIKRKKQAKGNAEMATPSPSRATILVAVTIALLGGVTMAVVENWEALFPDRRGPAVDVFWTHDCSCVFGWIDELKAAGLRVRSFEFETLQYKRSSLRMPPQLHGCHVASYLGYFVEGHVPASAIQLLAERHPPGRGLSFMQSRTAATSHSGLADSQTDELLFFNETDEPIHWPEESPPSGRM